MLDLQMKIQSLGMIEFTSIAAGIESADHMVKAAMVEPLFVKTICPGNSSSRCTVRLHLLIRPLMQD